MSWLADFHQRLAELIDTATAYHRRVAEVEADMPPDNSAELLQWAFEEYRLGEAVLDALARIEELLA